jgi:hypothetical protein
MAKVDRSVDLLVLLRGGNQNNGEAITGLYVVKVATAEPEATLIFEGSDLPLGTDIFEIPVRLLPLEEGSRYFALPIANGQRWGIIDKLDGKGVEGSFTAGTKTITVSNGLITEIN